MGHFMAHFCVTCGAWCDCPDGDEFSWECTHCDPDMDAGETRACLHPNRIVHTITISQDGRKEYSVCANCGTALVKELVHG